MFKNLNRHTADVKNSSYIVIEGYGIGSKSSVNVAWCSDNSEFLAHGECEQFHSEIKTDMDMERLLSGKFETNELVLELAILAYNILRMIGQESIGRKGTETKHKVRRRRLRTVIGNMIMMASHVTEHARQLLLGLGRSNTWRYAFAQVYTAFADFRS